MDLFEQPGGDHLHAVYRKIGFIRENGRKLKEIECGIEFWAVGPHVWCVRSATQYNYAGAYHRWTIDIKNRVQSGLDAAIERGAKANRREGICYCEYSDTIRQWPYNYLLALNDSGNFCAAPDKASNINGHSLSLAIKQCKESPTPQKLAYDLDKAFYG